MYKFNSNEWQIIENALIDYQKRYGIRIGYLINQVEENKRETAYRQCVYQSL